MELSVVRKEKSGLNSRVEIENNNAAFLLLALKQPEPPRLTSDDMVSKNSPPVKYVPSMDRLTTKAAVYKIERRPIKEVA